MLCGANKNGLLIAQIENCSTVNVLLNLNYFQYLKIV